jgi:NAD(P)H-flavin reductase
MTPQKYSVKVVGHTNPSTTFHVVTFEVEGVEIFDFTPGQFVALRVDPSKVNDYSLASLPRANQFDLIVDVKPGHEGSYFIHELRIGDKAEIFGPCGTFVLNEDQGAQELVMMATGSGIAPIKAMVEQFLTLWKDSRKLHLYFGLRSTEDIFMHEFFDELTKKYKNFKFTPCLSRPDIFWEGEAGHITELVEEDYKNGAKLSVYLCGNKLMIEQGKEIMLNKGTPKERIYHEVF